MGKRFITSSQSSIAKARALRHTMTEAEKKFWPLVRNNRLGVKFRRQVPIGPYIIDFFCFSAKLAVELDGGQHYTTEGKGLRFSPGPIPEKIWRKGTSIFKPGISGKSGWSDASNLGAGSQKKSLTLTLSLWERENGIHF